MIRARLLLDRGDFRLDVDLALPGRGVSAVFGPSGCGKTTLLRAIAGLEHSANGRLQVGDQVWQDEQRFVAPHRRALGYVFQQPGLFAHLDVRGNLDYAQRRVPRAQRRVAWDDAVDLLGLSSLLQRRPDGLSGGEQQRVAIARALLTSPSLLLLDEPLAALDLAARAEILPFLQQLERQLDLPMLYVSHSPDEVAQLADQVVLLDAGRVTAVAPVAEILTRADLPLSHRADAEAVVNTRVESHDTNYQLTSLRFARHSFSVPYHALPPDHPVRLRIAARDVSLTLAPQTGTSILNIFPATVTAVSPQSPSQVTVHLRVDELPILSRVTRKSADLLDLRPGQPVYAQIKSIALSV